MFKFGSPVVWRYIEVEAERVGNLPIIPAPYEYYVDKSVLARRRAWDCEVLPPVPTPDGKSAVFRVIAKYLYYLDSPPNFMDEDGIPIGANPITKFENYDNRLKLRFGRNMGLTDDEPGAVDDETGPFFPTLPYTQ